MAGFLARGTRRGLIAIITQIGGREFLFRDLVAHRGGTDSVGRRIAPKIVVIHSGRARRMSSPRII